MTGKYKRHEREGVEDGEIQSVLYSVVDSPNAYCVWDRAWSKLTSGNSPVRTRSSTTWVITWYLPRCELSKSKYHEWWWDSNPGSCARNVSIQMAATQQVRQPPLLCLWTRTNNQANVLSLLWGHGVSLSVTTWTFLWFSFQSLINGHCWEEKL